MYAKISSNILDETVSSKERIKGDVYLKFDIKDNFIDIIKKYIKNMYGIDILDSARCLIRNRNNCKNYLGFFNKMIIYENMKHIEITIQEYNIYTIYLKIDKYTDLEYVELML